MPGCKVLMVTTFGRPGYLRRAMAANLADLKWLGPQTRREALAKLAAFTPKIGAPARFKTYEGLNISPTNPLANNIAAAKWNHELQLSRMGKPVDHSEWYMLPQTVNAYYNSTFNEVVFPAAILQPPFFNASADPAVNYGGIGAVIGHEMGHGFDDQGAKSDGAGNLRDWWTPEDKANFVKMTDALVGQYNAHCPLDEGKTCINGRLTLGENIGDLGGISLAYRAYKLSLNGKKAPVIGGLTGDQRFFMAWAQVWRAKAREAVARGASEVCLQGGIHPEFTGQSYLFNYGLPHFFFHTTTAYAILRHSGVEIGKKDYIGTY